MNEMIVTISGLPGSGTSTAANLLKESTGMEVINSGDVFRKMAKERGVSLTEFGRIAEKDPSIDNELDDRMLEQVEPGIILEGRLTGQLLHKEDVPAFKVWLEAPLDVRVERIADREGSKPEDIREFVIDRERSEFKRYREYYGIDMADKDIYDLVIDSDKNDPDEIVEKIIEVGGIEVRDR